MKKLLVVVISFLGITFIILSFSELQDILNTLKHSHPLFLGLAFALLLLWVLNEAARYRVLYKMMGIQERLLHLSMLTVAANFVNVVAPTAGAGGLAVFLDDAGKRKIPRGRAAAVAALFLFFDYAAFMVILALGIIVLIQMNNLNPGEVSASAVMVLLFLGFGSLIRVGSDSGEKLGRVLAWLSRLANRILWPLLHRDYLPEAVALNFGHEVSEGLSILRARRRGLLLPFLYALGSKCLQTLILLMTFLSFDASIAVGTVIAGFAICYLFLIVSPTPSGIGVVEGILPLALTSLGVDWEQSVVITLAYRGVTFWCPLMLGALAFRTLEHN